MLSSIQEKFQKKIMQWCLMNESRFNQKSPVIALFARIEGEKINQFQYIGSSFSLCAPQTKRDNQQKLS